MTDNPIWFYDPEGNTIVDKNDNKVEVTRDKNNNLQYSFNPKYSDKELAKAKQDFLKNTAPILEAMNQSKAGYDDIQTLNIIPTDVRIINSTDKNTLVNAHQVPVGNTNGYYDYVTITFYSGNYDPTKSGDFGELCGSTMTVEVAHLGKDEILKENTTKWDRKDPSNAGTQLIYGPLMNKCTSFRIQYRIEHNQPITIQVFQPLDKYKLPYDADNQKQRDILNKK